jgi:hypothetical protein
VNDADVIRLTVVIAPASVEYCSPPLDLGAESPKSETVRAQIRP